jgi:hypothetical protein
MARVGPTAEDANCASHAGAPAPTGDEIGEPGGVWDAAMSFNAAAKEAVTDKVDILVVQEDRNVLSHRASSGK